MVEIFYWLRWGFIIALAICACAGVYLAVLAARRLKARRGGLKDASKAFDVPLLNPAITAIAVSLATLGVIVQLSYQESERIKEAKGARENLTRAIQADVGSILQMVSEAEVAEHFILLFIEPERPHPWASAPRREDYFTIYKAFAGEIGRMNGSAQETMRTEDVVKFYTYLKGSRDAATALDRVECEWTGKQKKEFVRVVVIPVIQILLRVYESGNRILKEPNNTVDKSRERIARFAKHIQNKSPDQYQILADEMREWDFVKNMDKAMPSLDWWACAQKGD